MFVYNKVANIYNISEWIHIHKIVNLMLIN